MAVTFEQAKAMLEGLFLEDCPKCEGTGKDTATGSRCADGPGFHDQPGCDGAGKILSPLGSALIEFLGDHLEKFAEKDHSHTVR